MSFVLPGDVSDLKVDLFDFELPEERIALRPVEPRDAARMLVVRPGPADGFADSRISALPALLRSGDVLVVNDTKVIPARLHARRERPGGTGAMVECLLHQRVSDGIWTAFARPAKRLKPGDVLRFGGAGEACLSDTLNAHVASVDGGGLVTLEFELAGPYLESAIAIHGELPLPPYIAGRRAVDSRDSEDYQTVYARQAGAVAAPTAGLHFTDTLLHEIALAGAKICRVTLHVGAGTFLPVKADDTEDHTMHAEYGIVGADVARMLNAARAGGGRIIAVGTTSLRLLESSALTDGEIAPFSGETDIFITPGYRFRAVDALLTNFHLPRSTLFMLVSAFSGLETMRAAYGHAIEQGYRFYSYGDCCLLFPEAR